MYRSNNTEARIYIGNLPSDIRSREVEDLFERYGKILDVDIKHPRTGSGPAFAFLEFDDPRDAQDAIRGRDGYDVSGSKIRVEIPQSKDRSGGSYRGGGGGFSDRDRGPRGGFSGRGGRGRGGGPPRRSDFRVLISGLPGSGSWQDIKDHMRDAGDVVYADVYRDGTGVVEFQQRDDMEYAVKNLDKSKFKSHEGETSYIRVKVDGGISRRSRSRSRDRSVSRSRSRSPRR